MPTRRASTLRKDKTKNTLLLGVAKLKINPVPGELLIGYPTKRPNTGIGSDLYVRTAVFGDSVGKPSAALAVLDILQVPAPVVETIRRAVKKAVPGLNPKAVMIASTHTHSAPVAYYLHKNSPREKIAGPNPRYLPLITKAVVASIVQAWKQKRRVTVSHGITEAHLGHNRRVVVHGYAHNEWEDVEGRHQGYFNPDINFVCFRDAGSRKIHAIIAGYGCHPVTQGPGNTKVSADYPGYFVRELEKATGADVAIHITTGAANINPRLCLRDTPEQAQIVGKTLAQAVVASMDKALPVGLKPVLSRTALLKFLLRSNMQPDLAIVARTRAIKQHLHTEVQAIHLGDLAFVSAPGELFAEIATKVRKQSPVKTTLVVEHANDAVSYIFTDAAALEGAYEVCRGSISENMERPYLASALKALVKK